MPGHAEVTALHHLKWVVSEIHKTMFYVFLVVCNSLLLPIKEEVSNENAGNNILFH